MGTFSFSEKIEGKLKSNKEEEKKRIDKIIRAFRKNDREEYESEYGEEPDYDGGGFTNVYGCDISDSFFVPFLCQDEAFKFAKENTCKGGDALAVYYAQDPKPQDIDSEKKRKRDLEEDDEDWSPPAKKTKKNDGVKAQKKKIKKEVHCFIYVQVPC